MNVDYLKRYAIVQEPTLVDQPPPNIVTRIFFVCWIIVHEPENIAKYIAQLHAFVYPIVTEDKKDITEEDMSAAFLQFKDGLRSKAFISVAPPNKIPENYKGHMHFYYKEVGEDEV